MSADIHRLGMGEGDAQAGGAVPLSAERSVYLDAYLAPFRRWLDRDTVTEIMVNRPGEVWIEDAASPGMAIIPDTAPKRSCPSVSATSMAEP